MTPRQESLQIDFGEKLVTVRQAVRAKAEELRFSLVDQTRIITAASELARNTLKHGGGGSVPSRSWKTEFVGACADLQRSGSRHS